MLDSVAGKLKDISGAVGSAVTQRAEAAQAVVTKEAEAAKAVVTKEAEAAKAVVTKEAEAAKAAATEKAAAAKAVVTEKVHEAKAAVDEAKAVVREKTEPAKQVSHKVDEKIAADPHLSTAVRIAQDVAAVGSFVLDPAMGAGYQAASGIVSSVEKAAEKPVKGEADPATAKAYGAMHPMALEAGATYLDEKAKGASSSEATLAAVERAVGVAPFAAAERQFEKAGSEYERGHYHAAVAEAAKGAVGFVAEVVEIASVIDMSAGGLEAAEAAKAAIKEAPKVQAPKTETPQTEGPKTEASKTDAPKTEAPKADAPKADAKAEAPKTEASKTEAPQTDAPKTAPVPEPLPGSPETPATPETVPRPETPAHPTTPEQGTARAPELAGTANRPSQIDVDLSDRQPGPALEPNPRDISQTGDTPGLDTLGRPFAQQTVPRGRGETSAGEDLTGTDRRTGMAFNERNAAEIVNNLRVEYDPSAGRPVRVSYDVDAGSVQNPAESGRSFARDWSTEGAQGTNSAYKGSGYDRGHLAPREAFKGSVETERAADLHTNVVPMTPELNRGPGSPWREAEQAAVDLAKKCGSVRVEVEVHYAENAPTLRDGTPIPDSFVRRVTGPDGMVLREDPFTNGTIRVDPSITGHDGEGAAGDHSARIRIDSTVSSDGSADPTQHEGARLRDEDVSPGAEAQLRAVRRR